jgi:hypothetical protein
VRRAAGAAGVGWANGALVSWGALCAAAGGGWCAAVSATAAPAASCCWACVAGHRTTPCPALLQGAAGLRAREPADQLLPAGRLPVGWHLDRLLLSAGMRRADEDWRAGRRWQRARCAAAPAASCFSRSSCRPAASRVQSLLQPPQVVGGLSQTRWRQRGGATDHSSCSSAAQDVGLLACTASRTCVGAVTRPVVQECMCVRAAGSVRDRRVRVEGLRTCLACVRWRAVFCGTEVSCAGVCSPLVRVGGGGGVRCAWVCGASSSVQGRRSACVPGGAVCDHALYALRSWMGGLHALAV